MLAVRDQENLASSHQHGAAVKQQQQQAQASRQLGPKTPGARYARTPMKIPLNDENGGNGVAFKGGDKTNFVTPMTQRARAVLGDKTTNAKAKGLQTVNAKGPVKEVEQSQVKSRNTVRPKQREPQAETQKLQVHVEETDPSSEDEIEYCPPRPRDLRYESDVFPDGVLTFDALKRENVMRGYHRYYFNPVDRNGVSKSDRLLRDESRKTMKELERGIKEDLDQLDWSVKAELDPDPKVVKKASASTMLLAPRNPLSTVRSRSAASFLSMDDTTKSMQRKAGGGVPGISKPVHKKSSSVFVMPTLRAGRPAGSQLPAMPKRSGTQLEATSRTTIGYNRGRATASLLNRTTASGRVRQNPLAPTPAAFKPPRAPLSRSNTTLSNDSDRTVTPSLYAHERASASGEDDEEAAAWERRVPFLSVFDPRHRGSGEDEEEEEEEEEEVEAEAGSDDDLYGNQGRASTFPDDDDGDATGDFELKLLH
ncbi:hypothetical protein SAMD00023353_0901560 [Rosellinia necatrix]|uniref:Uncharacterized protein n=1 Tax=Rosellinia necatrix TaxID=77044 RepID=A0A1W2THR5_ROSNE|nr:hypothetical protein SAMD00023353_0901560 [Rosellinia necatrix]